MIFRVRVRKYKHRRQGFMTTTNLGIETAYLRSSETWPWHLHLWIHCVWFFVSVTLRGKCP